MLLRSLPDLPFAPLLLAACGRAPIVAASPAGDIAIARMDGGSAIVVRPAAGALAMTAAPALLRDVTLDGLASHRLDLEVLQRWAELVELVATAQLTRAGVDAVLGAVRRVVDRRAGDDAVAEVALLVARQQDVELGDGGEDSAGVALVDLALAMHELVCTARQTPAEIETSAELTEVS